MNLEQDGKLKGRELQLKGKKAEQFIHELAYKTFLTDWCYTNPEYLDKGIRKELCDLLVVFDDIAIIWQIKDLKLDEIGKYKEQEIEKNNSQIIGAFKSMFKHRYPIELENPRRGKELFDPNKIKRTYLISALIGLEQEV